VLSESRHGRASEGLNPYEVRLFIFGNTSLIHLNYEPKAIPQSYPDSWDWSIPVDYSIHG
jgi:hypothetical protein